MNIPEAEKYTRVHRRRRRWRNVVTCLAAVVVFCTTYALILPAITMGKQCNVPEHTHDENCYTISTQTQLVCTALKHQHTQDCLDDEGNYICAQEDFFLHTHDERCYDAKGVLVCTLPEITTHVHTDQCYTHDENGTSVLSCTLPQVVPHEHTKYCMDADGNCVCGQMQVLSHQHDDSCFSEVTVQNLVCTLREHTHSGACAESLANSGYIQEFRYEDSQLSLILQVRSSQPLPEGAELVVSGMDSEKQTLLQGTLENQTGSGQWLARHISLICDGVPLDTKDYTMTAQVSIHDAVLEALPLATSGAETVNEVVLWQVNDEAELMPLDNALFQIGESAPALTAQVESGTLVMLAGTTANPHYFVQYYGKLYRAEATDSGTVLEIIDTRGGILPDNHTPQTTVKIPLTQVPGMTATSNYGDSSPYYKIATTETLMELYTQEEFDYVRAPNTTYVDKLADSSGYSLSQVWVLKGSDPNSTDLSDWTVYNAADVHFTNRQEFAENNSGDNVIWIHSDSVVRLIYAPSQNEFSASAVFYDYDISSGQNSAGEYLTGTAGINSEENYGTSANGLRTWRSWCDVLAFGNSNTGTGMASYSFDGGYLNRANSLSTVGKCTFGLAKCLKDGKIVYNDYLVVPNLFNDGDAVGKHTYSDSSLVFKRVGDTYTLSSATAEGLGTITNLEYFFNPSPKSGTVHSHIFTNNFWPMDQATNKTDLNFGGTANVASQLYRGYASTDGLTGNWSAEAKKFPLSDDGNDHNSYFGMQYSIQFTLTADYVGPLDYTFFGDDDMWVFLDDKLICDIGGIHSSVGEYVDLWDYLEKGSAGTYTLTFFYTERGASGSTCYMSFTLPSVTGVNIEQKTSDLTVEKEVVGDVETEQEFTFQIRFYDKDGNAILDDYAYTRYDKDGNVLSNDLIICDGAQFSLKAGERINIRHLPYGLRYTIQEILPDGYTVFHSVNGVVHSGSSADGTIIMDVHSKVIFTNIADRVGMTVQKQNSAGAALTGAIFRLYDSDGNLLRFTADADGGYSAVSDTTDTVLDGEKYYLALSENPDYVLGIDGSGDNARAVLRNKNSDSALVLTATAHADGSYSFHFYDGNLEMHLDLYGGGLTNGTSVNFWQNTVPTENENQKWFLLRNSDGSLTVQPRKAVLNKSSAVLDVTNGTIADGTPLQIYTGNGTVAQKWILVPADTGQEIATVTELPVDANGRIHISGLIPGTYRLSEVQAPTHCIIMAQDALLHVSADGTVTVVESNGQRVSVDEDNNTLLRVINDYANQVLTLRKEVEVVTTDQKFSFRVTYLPIGAQTPTVVTVTLGHDQSTTLEIPYGAQVSIEEPEHDGFALTFRSGSETLDAPDGVYRFTMTSDLTVTAVNIGSYELPATGGHGTLLYTAGGAILLVVALCLLYMQFKRRKEDVFS